jgi:hypothetical protein
MLNPSTADANLDDPTIRKCRGFSERLGAGSFEVGNLFAYRSTEPAGLLGVDDPVGPCNDELLEIAMQRASRVIFAWGAHVDGVLASIAPERVKAIYALAARLCVVPECLGVSQKGHPRHPLYVKYDVKPATWIGAV